MEIPDMFGTAPSYPARKAEALFKEEGVGRILELGGGQGRDTLFFAGEGFKVCTIDYSKEGIAHNHKKSAGPWPLAVDYGAAARYQTTAPL